VKFGKAARTSALDVVSHLGDYVMLLGCLAMTIVVVAGLQNAGMRSLKLLRSWTPRTNDSFEHVLSLREAMNLYPLPAPEIPQPQAFKRAAPQAPAQPTFAQELTMTPSQLINRWNPFIAEASQKFGLSADWIRAVMRVETGGRTLAKGNAPLKSHAGAVGVMQMMPKTYQAMRAQYGLGANPSNPHDSVLAGAAYLRMLYHRYGFPNMFAAYNGGPGTLEDHLQNGAPLPNETVNYVASVTKNIGTSDTSDASTSAVRGGRHHRRLTQYASLGGRHHRIMAALGS
jgi:hypothetical protein